MKYYNSNSTHLVVLAIASLMIFVSSIALHADPLSEALKHQVKEMGGARVGAQAIANCKVLIPDFGDQAEHVVAALIEKGYKPEVTKDLKISNSIAVRNADPSSQVVFSFGEFSEDQALHYKPELAGTLFISGELNLKTVFSSSTLLLGVAGQKRKILAKSSKITALSIRDDAVLFSVKDFPNCVDN